MKSSTNNVTATTEAFFHVTKYCSTGCNTLRQEADLIATRPQKKTERVGKERREK